MDELGDPEDTEEENDIQRGRLYRELERNEYVRSNEACLALEMFADNARRYSRDIEKRKFE